jgi:parvulin-like peptidyl-prolyl isomerase
MINRATTGDRAAAAVLAEKFMADAKKAALSEDAFQVQLKAMGMSMEAFQKRVMDQALSESVLERELKSTINITDAQTRDFYDTGTDLIIKLAESDVAKLTTNAVLTAKDLADGKSRIEDMKKANLERLQRPERVKVAHILLLTRDRETDQPLPENVVKEKRKQIEVLRDRAQKGEDFSELIKKYSEDRGVKETGGIYTLSQAEPFAPEFKAAAFSLTTNQISDVVQTVVGCHVIKQLERLPARKSTYDEVTKDLKEFLTQQEYQRLMPEYFDKLKKEAQVEILDAKYKIEEAIKAVREGR